MNETIKQHIEALIFAANEPITFKEIRSSLESSLETSITKIQLELLLQEVKDKYQDDAFVFEPIEIAGGYQFLTKSPYHKTIGIHLKQKSKKRLSRAALETLSIIAYKQPVTKVDMEKIRGVNCDYAVSKLLEKELISITGRSEGPGRPLIYGTSPKFMDYFGIKSLKDLPQLKDLKQEENQIGEPKSIEENS